MANAPSLFQRPADRSVYGPIGNLILPLIEKSAARKTLLQPASRIRSPHCEARNSDSETPSTQPKVARTFLTNYFGERDIDNYSKFINWRLNPIKKTILLNYKFCTDFLYMLRSGVSNCGWLQNKCIFSRSFIQFCA